MSFVVIATWIAKPGEADYVADTIKKMIPGNRAEPKTLAFHAQRSDDNPDEFVLFEEYTDPTGYDDHKAGEAFQRLVVSDVLARLESRTVRTYSSLDPVNES